MHNNGERSLVFSSFQEEILFNLLNINPTPFTKEINLDFGEEVSIHGYSLFNSKAKKNQTKEFSPIRLHSYTIELDNLNKGIYFIQKILTNRAVPQ